MFIFFIDFQKLSLTLYNARPERFFLQSLQFRGKFKISAPAHHFALLLKNAQTLQLISLALERERDKNSTRSVIDRHRRRSYPIYSIPKFERPIVSAAGRELTKFLALAMAMQGGGGQFFGAPRARGSEVAASKKAKTR